MGKFNDIAESRYGKMIYNVHDTFVGRSVKEYGEWCQGELDLLKEIIKPRMTVIDVGANIGTHALAFSHMVGKEGKVLAFEPQRHIFYALAGTVALNSMENVWCYYNAVSDEPGMMKVSQLNFEQPNNFGALAIDSYIDPNNFEEVPVISIDDLNLSSCHLIKADAEGMEEKVLRSAINTIEKHRPILFVEDERVDRSESLYSFIHSLGYEVIWHHTPFYNPNNFNKNEGNIFGDLFSKNMFCIPKEKVKEFQGVMNKVQ